jgi:osmotically-inducible protein OsmY
MKRIVFSILILVLTGIVFITPALSKQANDTMAKKERASKPKNDSAPKSDSEVQKCIMDKFSNSEKLKPQGFSASVSNGEAKLTGNAQNSGSKGAATRIAKNCGARSVSNNITAPNIPRPKKSDSEKNK